MIVKLLVEHHLEFLSLKEAAEARPSLHLSKCQIVGNLMHWLIFKFADKGNQDNQLQNWTRLDNLLLGCSLLSEEKFPHKLIIRKILIKAYQLYFL